MWNNEEFLSVEQVMLVLTVVKTNVFFFRVFTYLRKLK